MMFAIAWLVESKQFFLLWEIAGGEKEKELLVDFFKEVSP